MTAILLLVFLVVFCVSSFWLIFHYRSLSVTGKTLAGEVGVILIEHEGKFNGRTEQVLFEAYDTWFKKFKRTDYG